MTNDIIILQQLADTVILYANCVKNGYDTIRYFTDPDEIRTISAAGPEIVIDELTPGEYYLYAENKEQEKAGYTFFTVSGLTKETAFQNILAESKTEVEESVLSSLSKENYVEDLYALYTKEKISEEALLAFTDFYNAREEELNTDGYSEFTIADQTIASRTGILYDFIPYRYDVLTKSWKMLPDQVVHRTEEYAFSGKPSEMYRILVLSDFSVVRRYFLYQPSENVSETILERRIQTRENREKKLAERLSMINLEEIEEDKTGQDTVATLLYFRPEHTVFRAPEVITDGIVLSCHVADASCITVMDRLLYLAVLELAEAFADDPKPHKYKIESENFTVQAANILLNSDTEYLCYISDENNTKLSDLVLISLNPEYPVDLYTAAYRRTVYDEYVRRLNSVFKEYAKDKWNTAALLLEQYLLYQDIDVSLTKFMWQQCMSLNPERDRIDQMLALVTLCQTKYYTNIDQGFIHHQVYSKEFKDHVFPEQPVSYIVRATRLNHGQITYDYYAAGTESLNLRMDKDEYLILQCINPNAWSLSAPAFYNNRIKSGTPYLYFPKLEVEVI